jgi:AcrR family transcriptional regulator
MPRHQAEARRDLFNISNHIGYDPCMSKTNGSSASGQEAAARKMRRYRSALRDERAADTRARIVTAARDLFAARGFADTTVARIADRAGVAQPTVYAVFGSKGAIMRELLARLEDDADAARWRSRLESENDPVRKLEHYAAWHRQLFSTNRDVLAAAIKAGSDPAVVELREQGDRSAYDWLRPLVRSIAEAGALAPGLTEQRAQERTWIITGPELYFRITDGCGWPDEEYERWLAQMLCAQLLDPRYARRQA